MVSKERGVWIQCQSCGNIYHIEKDVPIDQLYVASTCPKCNGKKGLNCGSDKNDIYLFYDCTKDPRWYY